MIAIFYSIIKKRAAFFAALFFFSFLGFSWPLSAAPIDEKNSFVTIGDIRFGKKYERERLVLEMDALLPYEVMTDRNNMRLIVELKGAAKRNEAKQPLVRGDLVRQIFFRRTAEKFIITIDLKAPATYIIKTLAAPTRFIVDFYPKKEDRPREVVPLPVTGKSPDMSEKSGTAKRIVPVERRRRTERQREPREIEKIELPARTERKLLIARGLVRTDIVQRTEEGEIRGYILAVDPKRFALRPALANGIVPGRAVLTKIAATNRAIAAINASYFDLDGTILGLLKIDGQIVGTSYIRRTALGIYDDGRAVIAPIEYDGRVALKSVNLPLSGVNAERGENALILYNDKFGSSTKTNNYGREFVIKNGVVTAIGYGNTPIQKGEIVLSAHGASRDALVRVQKGDRAVITEDIGKVWEDIPHIIGAGPRLVAKGKMAVTKTEEAFPADIAHGRAPRTAVGIKSDGTYLLVVVDGRQHKSIGLTLEELADFLIGCGAVEAVNFDGGGSSEMVIRNSVINSPSDGTERPIGSALVVVRKR